MIRRHEFNKVWVTMKRLLRKASAGLGALAALTAPPLALADPARFQLNMTPGVTQTSHAVYNLHMLIFYVCVAIGFIVFGAMAVSMVKFRKSKGAVAATWSHNTTAELVWTVVPVLILILMALPATRVLINMSDSSKSEMTVKITGYQWKWRYQILDYRGQAQNVNFMSTLDMASNKARQLHSGIDPASVPNYLLNVDKPLVLPTNTKIRFVVTADDVIHAWWVPDLGWKQDAIPGFINDAWTKIDAPGVYRGQCTELCGKDHGFMPIVVEVKSRADFEQWLAAQPGGQGPAAAVAAAEPTAPAKG
jgi:cytochrome c oxidase subunit 2